MATYRQVWGARMKQARIAAGLTHRQASVALDVDQSIIWRWETGNTSPTPENQQRIAALYGVAAGDLFRAVNGDEQSEPASVA